MANVATINDVLTERYVNALIEERENLASDLGNFITNTQSQENDKICNRLEQRVNYLDSQLEKIIFNINKIKRELITEKT